jgi:hypothetical protein
MDRHGPARAFVGAHIFDGERWHEDAALVTRGREVECIIPAAEVPGDAETLELKGGILAPGFVDCQVNGGGGVMLNDRQDVEAIRTICAAHAPFGTTALLVTLITDTPEIDGSRGRGLRGGAATACAGTARPASRRAASLGRAQGRARSEADPPHYRRGSGVADFGA